MRPWGDCVSGPVEQWLQGLCSLLKPRTCSPPRGSLICSQLHVAPWTSSVLTTLASFSPILLDLQPLPSDHCCAQTCGWLSFVKPLSKFPVLTRYVTTIWHSQFLLPPWDPFFFDFWASTCFSLSPCFPGYLSPTPLPVFFKLKPEKNQTEVNNICTRERPGKTE